jgi:hypothetical protein
LGEIFWAEAAGATAAGEPSGGERSGDAGYFSISRGDNFADGHNGSGDGPGRTG